MTIRTEGDIVLASNMAQDLTNLVVAYLEFYKKYAQGINGIRIPTERYTVIFQPMQEAGKLAVKLIYTKTTTWQEPEYYDVDSDYFDESWGASNVSGYSIRYSNSIEEEALTIPFSLLLLSRDAMEKQVIDFANRKKAEAEEQERLAEIAKYKAKIEELEARAKS